MMATQQSAIKDQLDLEYPYVARVLNSVSPPPAAASKSTGTNSGDRSNNTSVALAKNHKNEEAKEEAQEKTMVV